MPSRHDIINYLLNEEIKFATVSGVWSTKMELVEKIDREIPEIRLITTKSYQITANPGNREPIVGEKSVGSYVNAVGLRNPGMDVAYKELKALRERYFMSAVLNVSVSGNSPEEFITLVKKFEDMADIIELNFSCPHAKPGYGASIGVNPDLVKEYMEAIRPTTKALLFPKLTPNVDDISAIAAIAVKAGADGIVAVNTVGPEAYREPESNELLLFNPNEHKGGRSGEHIFNEAVLKVAAIRQAVGKNIPIIGMGGVSSGRQARDMKNAGASVIGVGSAIARVDCHERKDYFKALKQDVLNGSNSAESFLSVKALAKYEKYIISEKKQLSDTMLVLTLKGRSLDFDSSQYAFIWMPGVGEKPFGIVQSDPLTFIIRKRHHDREAHCGTFTHELFHAKEGEAIYVRGPYGKKAPVTELDSAIIVSGGTGLAITPGLVRDLQKEGKQIQVFHGISRQCEITFQDIIPVETTYVCDDGKPGRVLDDLQKALRSCAADNTAVYTIGPDILMEKVLKMCEASGIDSRNAFASLETNHMCGIGMCGECQCGGVLGCKDGTFLDYEFLKKHYFNK